MVLKSDDATWGHTLVFEDLDGIVLKLFATENDWGVDQLGEHDWKNST